MDSLLTIGLAAAGILAISQATNKNAANTPPPENKSPDQLMPAEQQKLAELTAQGIPIQAVQSVTTPEGQQVTQIVISTPNGPQGVVLSEEDRWRLDGAYIPQIPLTPALQAEMSYAGYPTIDAFMQQAAGLRIWFRNADLKFKFRDWEYFRKRRGDSAIKLYEGFPYPLTPEQAGSAYNSEMTQEEYVAFWEQFRARGGVSGIYRRSNWEV